jgi:hypothetical protein
MRPVRLLLAALLLVVGCATEQAPVAESVPARPAIDRADRQGQLATTPPEPPGLPAAEALVRGHPDVIEQGERAVALLDFPRRDCYDLARQIGAAAVLGKPWLNADLVTTVDDVVRYGGKLRHSQLAA